MRRMTLGIIGLVVAALAVAHMVPGQTVRKVPWPHKRLGNIDRQKWAEPSGIVYHPGRKTLFVVSDEGHVAEIKTDGTPVRKRMRKQRADYEGITVDPATGLLYVAVEGKDRILELDPETLLTKREFDLERTFEGRKVLKPGGDGIEAVEFVPKDKHPEGGTFYVTNQGWNLKATEDVSAVLEVELPIRTAKPGGPLKGKILRMFSLGVIDLSALHYDAGRERLYVVADSADTLFEVTLAGKVTAAYVFPGRDQEGFTVDPDDCAYIAQDCGGILKYKWLRKKEQDTE